MSAKASTLTETPSGIGEMLRAGRHLAKVFYHLEVRRAEAGWEIEGQVTVSQDEPMQTQVASGLRSGEVLTLVLDDGRRLDVHAGQANQFEVQYHVTAANAAGFGAG